MSSSFHIDHTFKNSRKVYLETLPYFSFNFTWFEQSDDGS